MTVKVFGDSHVKALRSGWQQLKSDRGILSRAWKRLKHDAAITSGLSVEFYASDGRFWLDCDVLETATSFHISQRRQGGETLEDYIVDKGDDVYFFSSLLHSAPLYRHHVWQTCCPWTCTDSSAALQALSGSVIERWIDRLMKRRMEMLDRLREGGISLIVVEPPKPLKRSPQMLGIRSDVLIGASNLYRSYVSGVLDKKGIKIIPVPDETYDDIGFTKSKYDPSDPMDYHHGNALFGELVMKKIITFAA